MIDHYSLPTLLAHTRTDARPAGVYMCHSFPPQYTHARARMVRSLPCKVRASASISYPTPPAIVRSGGLRTDEGQATPIDEDLGVCSKAPSKASISRRFLVSFISTCGMYFPLVWRFHAKKRAYLIFLPRKLQGPTTGDYCTCPPLNTSAPIFLYSFQDLTGAIFLWYTMRPSTMRCQ